MKYGLLRITAMAALVLIAASAGWFASNLKIEQDNASMQSDEARNDPSFKTFQQEFNSNNELILTITRDDLGTDAGMSRLQNDINWIRGIEGVEAVNFPSRSGKGNGFISMDGKMVGLLVSLDPGLSRKARMEALDQLRLEASEHIEGTVHAVGLPLLKASVARHIARDQQVVTPLSGIVMMIILGLLFRRMAGVILPMLVVAMSLVSTLGLYAACGFELNSITSLLPPVVIVLSVSVAVHLFDAWIHAVDAGDRGDTAIRNAIVTVWKPCVFTAVMTAVGLLSLCLSPIPAVRLFGLFAAIGITFSIVYAFILFPVALAWATERPSPEKAGWILKSLDVLASAPVRHPAAILIVAMLISLAAVWEGSKIRNNTDLIHFFKKSDPTYIAHNDVNRALGSVRSLDLIARKTDGSRIDYLTDLPELADLADQIEKIPDVVRTGSIIDLASNDRAIPVGDASPLMQRFMSNDEKLLRMEIQLGDIGSARAAEISEQVRNLARQVMGKGWAVMPTGDYYQVVRDSNHLVSTLLKSFGITLVTVLISTGLLFRSFAVLLPAFIPNMLPIIWGAGLMGLLGIDLSTGTTMVAAVVIGLAVDDTIHYLHHFQTYRHMPVAEATRSTTRRIGRAVIVSSIVLVGGFWMGAFGSFIPTNTFALLTGCMMISALFCDLLVLPAYLNLIHAKPHPARKPL